MTTGSGRPKIFISWSMPLSQRVANILYQWLPSVIQGIEPWISTQSIYAGDYWHRQITENLRAANIGIVVVTKANQESTWLNYETGALAQSVTTGKGAVMPILVGMTVGELQGPMKNLQVNVLDKAGMRNVLEVINRHAQPELRESQLDREFDLKWPELEKEIADAVAELGVVASLPAVQPASQTPELSVEFVGTARAYNCDESLQEVYIGDRRQELFGDFPDTGERSSLLMSPGLKSESRSQGEFRREVDRWAEEVRRSWHDAVDHLAGAAWAAVTIRVANTSSKYLERLQVVITLPGSIDAVRFLDWAGFEFESQLPEKPRAWGPSQRIFFDPSTIDISAVPRPVGDTDIEWRRVGDMLEITLEAEELRPKRTIEFIDEIVLIIRPDGTDLQPIGGTWSATVRGLDEVVEGECSVNLESKSYDFTPGLRRLLEI